MFVNKKVIMQRIALKSIIKWVIHFIGRKIDQVSSNMNATNAIRKVILLKIVIKIRILQNKLLMFQEG